MNKKGSGGFINHTGEYGASSTLVDCRDPLFYQNIEDGIYSTVKALVNHGFFTHSSCQGHTGYNEIRSVTIQGDDTVINFLQYIIWSINQSHKEICIKYIILPINEGANLYKGVFTDGKRIQIQFGNCNDPQTLNAQKIFEDSIIKNKIDRIPYNKLWEMYSEDGSSHSDIAYEDK